MGSICPMGSQSNIFFSVKMDEVKGWHSLRESTQKGNESSLIEHYVMSFWKRISYTKEIKSIFLISTLIDIICFLVNMDEVEGMQVEVSGNS